jgi:hypothetical protein
MALKWKVMLQFKKTASNIYLEKNEEYDPNYEKKIKKI